MPWRYRADRGRGRLRPVFDSAGRSPNGPSVPSGIHHEHCARHGFVDLNPRVREGLVVTSRRSVLKASLAGLAGLTLPELLRFRAAAANAGRSLRGNKSVILLWMTGGPSHIDTWDVKPISELV